MSVETLKLKPELSDILTEVGLDIGEIAPRIVDRLELLNAGTHTLEDGIHAIEIAGKLFDFYKNNKPLESFNDVEKKIVLIGSIFSDIGKTGPPGTTDEQKHLITDMFGVENIKNPQMSVKEFFEMYFEKTALDKLRIIQDLQLDPEMTMRSFWNLHSLWTLQIISGDGVPPEAIAGAAMHHIIEGVNPEDIFGIDSKFTKYFGDNAGFDRPEKLIIILDKYDAFRRRTNKTSQEAVESVRNIIKRNEMFKNDEDFKTLLDDLETIFHNE